MVLSETRIAAPKFPSKIPQIPSNRDHKALKGGALRGVGRKRLHILEKSELDKESELLKADYLEAHGTHNWLHDRNHNPLMRILSRARQVIIGS